MAAAFWVLTSVCPCIENIVGTGLLKTTAGKRGLTSILLCTIFFFASANLEVFLLKKKVFGRQRGFTRNNLCRWLFSTRAVTCWETRLRHPRGSVPEAAPQLPIARCGKVAAAFIFFIFKCTKWLKKTHVSRAGL